MQVQRTDGSSAVSHAFSLTASHDLEGVDILTWPSYTPIWPLDDEDTVQAENFDLSNSCGYVNSKIYSNHSQSGSAKEQFFVAYSTSKADWST